MTRLRTPTAMAFALAAVAVVAAVLAGTASAVPFTNSASMVIPQYGHAPSYPSSITTAGLRGRISKVTVTLNELRHSCYPDLDVMLVGPMRMGLMLMSDAGTCTGDDHTTTLTFDDDAPSSLSCDFAALVTSGSYKPTNDPSLGADAPNCSDPSTPDQLPPYRQPLASALSIFGNVSSGRPSGRGQTWNLYVYDDDPGDAGAIGGWTLDVTIAPPLPPMTQITGRAVNGAVLTARTVTRDKSLVASEWLRCDSEGAGCSPIEGAVADHPRDNAYRLTTADVGRTIRLRQTATTSGGTGVFDTPPLLIAPRTRPCGNLIEGTSGDDYLRGGQFNLRLVGFGGDDALRGGDGVDCLSGGTGADRLVGAGNRDYLRGRAGSDRLSGGPGPDRLGGGGGDDVLVGGNGRDVLNGGTGHDRIDARDGRREIVRCGKGDDRVRADPTDKLIGCEEPRPMR